MENILNKIIETKRGEVARAAGNYPYERLLEDALAFSFVPVSFSRSLVGSPHGIIAEFKRRSPSRGNICETADPAIVVPGYARAGAAAVSVLTDRTYFGGSLADLRAVYSSVSLPLLRKDFIIDGYQVCEARMSGASAVLLIAAALSPGQAYRLARLARKLGLEVLLEIHRKEEFVYLSEYVDVVGINNRNLETFVTDVHTSFELASDIPDRYVKISESGISSPDAVCRLREAGYRGFLIGENFMKSPDPAACLEHFIGSL